MQCYEQIKWQQDGTYHVSSLSFVFSSSSLCYPTGQTLTRNGGLGYKDLPCLGKCTLILKLHFSFDGPMDFPDVCFSFTADDFGPKWKQNIVEHLSLLLQIAVSGLRVDIACTMWDRDLRVIFDQLPDVDIGGRLFIVHKLYNNKPSWTYTEFGRPIGATYKPRLAKGIRKEKNLELIGSRSGIWKPQDDHQNQFFHMVLSLCLPRL